MGWIKGDLKAKFVESYLDDEAGIEEEHGINEESILEVPKTN